MALPFEFIVDGPPVSQQARRGRVHQWRQNVRQVAEAYWAADAVAGPVRLDITHFYEDVALDVDNIPKPILDALKGVIFLDDGQVTDLSCRKRNLRSSFRIDKPSRILTEGLSRGNDFLYIVVMEAPDQEVIF